MAEPVDVSKKHFYISLVKSAVRIVAGVALIAGWYIKIGNLIMAGGALLLASRNFRHFGGTIDGSI